MKHYYALLLLICAISLQAQDYVPFGASSVKTFTTYPAESATYSLGFDLVESSGSTTFYFPYMGIEDYEVELSDTCASLGESLYCFPETRPLWLGGKITVDGSGSYNFTNINQNAIALNFNLPQGASTVFYQDSVSRFTLTGLPKSTEDVLGVADSIARVRINHTDLNGIPVNSPLNDFIVKTGKETGMITFFRIDSFPQILQPVIVIADQNLQTGLTDITNEDLYDYRPGDQLQYNEKEEFVSCHTEVLYNRFVNLTITERTDTQDSVIYMALRETFQKDSLQSYFDTVRLAYGRATVVAQMPYDINYHGDTYWKKSLGMVDYCGLPMWTYKHELMNFMYCEESNCWGLPLNNTTPAVNVETGIVGVGKYFCYSSKTILYDTYYYTYQLNYFKKGTHECGTRQVVAVNDIRKPIEQLIITPNPATEFITITGTSRNSDIRIINLNGQTVRSQSATAGTTRVSLNGLQKGVYIVKAGEKIGKIVVR